MLLYVVPAKAVSCLNPREREGGKEAVCFVLMFVGLFVYKLMKAALAVNQTD